MPYSNDTKTRERSERMVLSDIQFKEAYEDKEYKTITLYFTAPPTIFDEKICNGTCVECQEADYITISVEFPASNMEPVFASVSYSLTKDGRSYDWNDIDIPYEDIGKLIDLYTDAEKEIKNLSGKLNKPYAVAFTYSFDHETPVYLFETEEQAADFLRSSFREELRIDREENGWDCDGEISEDNGYAKITTHFNDGEDVTEFRLGNVYL